MNDRVLIHGLEVVCRIGVGDDERSADQTLRLDIEIPVPGGLRGLGDSIDRTIDYHRVCEEVRALAASKERRLVETLAEDIVAHLATHPGTGPATVRVRKFILPYTDWVGVELGA